MERVREGVSDFRKANRRRGAKDAPRFLGEGKSVGFKEAGRSSSRGRRTMSLCFPQCGVPGGEIVR